MLEYFLLTKISRRQIRRKDSKKDLLILKEYSYFQAKFTLKIDFSNLLSFLLILKITKNKELNPNTRTYILKLITHQEIVLALREKFEVEFYKEFDKYKT